MAGKKMLVVGSINMDLCLQMPKIPSGGESILCDSYQYIHGGKGANQAVAAARLGADVTFAGKVGSDAFGGILTEALNSIGICTNFVYKGEGARSGLAVIILEGSGQNRIMIYPESNFLLTKNEIDGAFAQSYDAMMIQFEIREEIVVHACRLAVEKGIPFVVDAGPAMDFPIEKISGAEILSPNETETYALCKINVIDTQSAKAAAEILFERARPKYIVIKAGENGAYLYDGKNIKHFGAYKVTAVDTTAAGDAFTAAMTLKYLENRDIGEAIRFAQAAGAVSVTKLGAQPSLPTLAEVEAFIGRENNTGDGSL